jgi:tRNA nucleotidyltransferase (CCA-adding enzyme)
MKSTKKKYDIQRDISHMLTKHPKINALVQLFVAHGARVLLVGGAVRDLLLGIECHDIDVEIYNISAHQVEALLDTLGTVMLVGKSFGVFRLAGLDVDVSLPRKDSAGRKPEVCFDPDLSFADAFRRRDLTINAMGIDLSTFELIDPWGGQEDLENKILRAPDPYFFVQDPLRFFRVMQFIGRLEFQPDATLNEVCRSMDVTSVSDERIEGEIEKLLLRSVRPSLGFRWLNTLGRLQDIFPELFATIGVPQRPDYHPEGDVFEHSMQSLDAAVRWHEGTQEEKLIVRYAALCHDLGKVTTTRLINGVYRALEHAQAGVKPTKALLHRITRKKECIAAVAKLVYHHMDPSCFISNGAKAAAYRRLALKLAPETTIEQLCALSRADRQGRNGTPPEPLHDEVPMIEQFKHKALESNVLYMPVPPLLHGKDIAHLVAAGPAMGVLLKKAYEIQIEEGILDKEILLKRLSDS